MIQKFIDLLKDVGRVNTDKLLIELKKRGFFEAPASANHHLNKVGGLVEHSLSVYNYAKVLNEAIKNYSDDYVSPDQESILISALLHDVCKSDIYIPTTKRQRDPNGVWIDVPGYTTSHVQLPMGHGEKSVAMILQSGYPLTDDEMLAIRWHMYTFDVNFNSYDAINNFNEANKRPLVKLIQIADQISTLNEC